MASVMRWLTAGDRAKTTAVSFLILSICILGGVVFFILKIPSANTFPDSSLSIATSQKNVATFDSEKDFKSYLDKVSEQAKQYKSSMTFGMLKQGAVVAESLRSEEANVFDNANISSTNVQVEGIDEPDIVKTDGESIFISDYGLYYASQRPVLFYSGFQKIEDLDTVDPLKYRVVAPQKKIVSIINVLPVTNIAKSSEIKDQGELLLTNDTLVVFSDNAITGYNISDPAQPLQNWQINIDDNQSVRTARLYQDTIYVVMQAPINYSQPCPLVPFKSVGKSISVRCNDIYHPIIPVSVDVTYTISSINAKTGQITNTVSFVGSQGSSAVNMSSTAVYITYTYTMPYADILNGFFKEEGSGLISIDVLAKIKELETYKISAQAKQVEIESILKEYLSSLSDNDRRRFENEAENRMYDYISKHSHKFEKTGIVKVDRRGLTVKEMGNVPGRLLNQFAIDEYDGTVRIATTVGDRFFEGGKGSVSDVYVLNDKLKLLGSVTDLGRGERIYSVRFVGDSAYVVTFRQTDPFYVLDLSKPVYPRIRGKLKIPGYSSYLHPITDDLILGVGKEGSSVKLSLFDVSNPDKPHEVDKYILDEYYSDIANTHHAFLLDPIHKIFFIPASEGGYVFSYDDNKLVLKMVVSMNQARRAVFIGNYLYVIGVDEIVVVDENVWKEVDSLRL